MPLDNDKVQIVVEEELFARMLYKEPDLLYIFYETYKETEKKDVNLIPFLISFLFLANSQTKVVVNENGDMVTKFDLLGDPGVKTMSLIKETFPEEKGNLTGLLGEAESHLDSLLLFISKSIISTKINNEF